jgi:hypothetical protein
VSRRILPGGGEQLRRLQQWLYLPKVFLAFHPPVDLVTFAMTAAAEVLFAAFQDFPVIEDYRLLIASDE